MVTQIRGDEAIKSINDRIFKADERAPITYAQMQLIAEARGQHLVDFTSLNNKKHHEALVNIVNEIFTKVSTPEAENVLALNKLLLKLPEAGLSKEVLTTIHEKYKEIFGNHIALKTEGKEVISANVASLEKAIGHTVCNANAKAISTHATIAKYAQSFDKDINKAIECAPLQEKLDEKWKQQELTNQQTKLGELQAGNDVLHKAFCGLGKFFNKGAIEKNRLEIGNLEEEIEVMKYDYEGFKNSPELVRREYKEMLQQKESNVSQKLQK